MGNDMKPALVRTSKWMSRVLRHAPDSVGLTLDEHGWVRVDDLLDALARHGRAVSRAELEAVVVDNDKQRFALRTDPDGVGWIRANQGHSARLEVDLDLPPRTPPELLYHGTSADAVPAILAEGLRPGSRQHVHLSVDVETAVRVGSRRPGAVAVLLVRSGELAATGHVFHRSANGVWLTDRVPAAYLTRHTG
jgi:putative RNA 2'-phosphotransferase